MSTISVKNIQLIQNAAARVLIKIKKGVHISPIHYRGHNEYFYSFCYILILLSNFVLFAVISAPNSMFPLCSLSRSYISPGSVFSCGTFLEVSGNLLLPTT
ncbi:hypothetical protein ILYODFUR_036416 [Ilyodon furcidens]|uniref:Uncharacterized protein n=1 Tax=Ilyodon furcidens TaxID=33524 RepID=A0ABV0SUA2_9TELE